MGEFSKVMQTRDVVEGLHNCLVFSQPSSCLDEEGLYCLILKDLMQNEKETNFSRHQKFIIWYNKYHLSLHLNANGHASVIF